MTVKEAIEKRRAYRILEPVVITEHDIKELVQAAQLAPSCYNHQPWRFVFVTAKAVLEQVFTALPEGNKWAEAASLVIAVFGKKENDCIIKERTYYLFDFGMAAAFIQLRATELGLIAHPIAGFSEEKIKDLLGIPIEHMVITLLIVGKKSEQAGSGFSEKQLEAEAKRPERRALEQIYSIDQYRAVLDAGNS